MSAHTSIQRRLTRSLVVLVLLVSALSGTLIYVLARRALTRQFDSALTAQARALAMLLKEEAPGQYEFDFADEIMPEFEQSRDPAYFQVWADSGKTIEKSRSLGRGELQRSQPGRPAHPAFHDLELSDGRSGRAVALTFLPHPDDEHDGEDRSPVADAEPAVVVVARSRAPVDRVLTMVLATIAAGVTAAALLAFVLVPWTVRRGLRPVRDLADLVSGIDADNLVTRVAPDRSPSELIPVYDRLNDLLTRISDSFSRERRFSSDVSHELRTPIAEAKTALEMVRRWPEDAEAVAQQSAAAAAAVEQMERIVCALLDLTRSGGATQMETEAVDVAAMTERITQALSGEASRRGIAVGIDAVPDATVTTSPALLESVLRNIVENAIVHSPEGAAVGVAVRRDGGVVTIRTENPAPELEQCDIPRLFDAFWCKDESRTAAERLGLGLSLVRLLCNQVGASVTATLGDDKRLLVRVAIPESPKA